MSNSTKFVYHRTIKVVEERFRKVHVSGSGPDAVMKEVSEGWHVTFLEEPVAMYLGTVEPKLLRAGDGCTLTLERVRPGNVVSLPSNKENV